MRHVNEPSVYYRLGRFLCYWLYRSIWRLEVHGVRHVPKQGPVIIAPNHQSYADPPLVGAGLPRPVHYLAKKELFRGLFGWLLPRINAHPLNRAHGIGALRTAQEVLEQGGVVAVFPEGKRNRSGQLLRPKAGVGLLAIKSRAPVIPTYIHNSNQLFEWKKLTVYYGEPLDPAPFSSYEEMSHAIMERIQKIKDQVALKI